MATHIQSLQNERIKKAVRLRDRRGRQQQGRIIIDGCREVSRALQADVRPLEVFVSDAHTHELQVQPIIQRLGASGFEPTFVTPDVFEKIAFGNRSEGVVMVAEEPKRRLAQLSLPDDALICVLERVEKPGNLGAIIRTADAAGVAAVVVADGGTDLYNHNAIRASLGAIFRVPVCAATAPDVLNWLRDRRFTIFAARVDGAVPYASVDYRGRSALVLGSEADGLSDIWRSESITAIALPMLGIVDSLNVAATAAVICYHALQQRQAEA